MDGYETGRRCSWLQSSIRHQARAREKDSCGEDRRRLAVRSRERRGLRTADARVVAGEALGLKWSDIDLNIGTLRVNQQVQRIRDDGVLVSSEPKNSSRHTMDLP
jgi:integrase